MKTHDDIVYFAGLFDGEGCIMITKPSNNKPRCHTLTIHLYNTHLPTLVYIRDIFGGCLRGTHPDRIALPIRRPQYVLEWYGSTASAILIEVYPFLKIKREEAEYAIHFQSLRKTPQQCRAGMTSEEFQNREGIRLKVKELKKVAYFM